MAHIIEAASSGRAKCRGCGVAIEKGTLRLGERLPNPFAEGREMSLWYHLICGAYKRPEVILSVLDLPDSGAADVASQEAAELRKAAEFGLQHRRLPRVNGGGRSPSGRARCRHCRELIERDTWRIGLVYFEEGQFNPSGYIHAGCAQAYLGTAHIADRIRHFAPEIEEDEVGALTAALKDSESGRFA